MSKRINSGVCTLFMFAIFSLPVWAEPLATEAKEAETMGAEQVVPEVPQQLTTDSVVLEKIMVEAVPEGSAAAGYRPETVKTTGPWGDKPILDTPYSIHVTSEELMESMIAGTSDQLIKFNPVVKPYFPTTFAGYTSSVIRGFVQNVTSMDGIPVRYTWLSSDTEEMERMEVFSGLSGFLYGVANVGGQINYVTKRPSATPIANIRVGNYGGEQYFGYIDLGGPIDKEGKFAYRFNTLYQNGDNAIGVGLRRSNFNGAFDWKVTDSFKISINGGYNDYKRTGTGGYTFSTPGRILPASDFDNKRPMTPNWGVNHMTQSRVGANINWDINEKTALRAGALYLKQTRVSESPSAMVLNTTGTYTVSAFHNEGPIQKNIGGYLYLDRSFDTFGILHKMTIGGNFSGYDNYQIALNPASLSATYATLEEAQHAPPFVFAPTTQIPKYRSGSFMNTNILIGDDITINQYFSLMVGVNRSTINSRGWNIAGVKTSEYDKAAVTPTVSLIFKPIPSVSLYTTYIESLENGGVVAENVIPPYTNAGEVMKPTISKSVEAGAKTNLGGTLLTLAFFQIDKANLYDVDNFNGTRTRTQDGRQINRGVELTATGKLTDDLTIMGGGTYLKTEITKTNTVGVRGKEAIGIPHWRLSLWGEYRMPFHERLFMNGGVSYVGSSYLDGTNTLVIPSHAIGDAGLRYEASIFGRPVILRFNVQNVTNEHYWQNAGASLCLGTPRTYTFSATFKLF